MYIHEFSGHHEAALALEKAFKALLPHVECRLIDALRYTHPVLGRLITRTYLEILKKRPEVWEYLYDNPKVLANTRELRRHIHKSDSVKLKSLLEEFRPDAVVCTQAFPCGIISDTKATTGSRLPLYGVLTDYLPHSYWIMENVNQYFVPSLEAKEKLHQDGIYENRISVVGIPMDFSEEPAASKNKPKGTSLVLVMGGSQGMGPIEKIVDALDRSGEDFGIAVATGRNKKLFRKLNARKRKFKKNVAIYPYGPAIPQLMQHAALLISKPGGLTIAQSLAYRLPIIFIDPIPGQEAMNASFLLRHHAAVEARSAEETALLAEELLRSPAKRQLIQRNMASLACPDAARRIAGIVLGGEFAA